MDPTIVAAGVVAVISAVGAAVVSVITAISLMRERAEARVSRQHLARTAVATDQKADIIIEKAKDIHALTNSNLSTVTTQLEVALAKIDGLNALVSAQQESIRTTKPPDKPGSDPARP